MGKRDAEGTKQAACEPTRARRSTAVFAWQSHGFTPALPSQEESKGVSDRVQAWVAGLVCSRIGAGALRATVLVMFSCSSLC